MPVTLGSVLVTAIGTTAPFSAISGASRLILSDGSAVLPYSVFRASASLFCLKASAGHSLASRGESREREAAEAEPDQAAGDGALEDRASRAIGRVGKVVHRILSLLIAHAR